MSLLTNLYQESTNPVNDLLKTRLGVDFDLWVQQDNSGLWSHVDDPARIHSMEMEKSIQLETLAGGIVEFAFLLNLSQQPDLLVTGAIETADQHLWRQFVESLQREIELQFRVEELQNENEQFAEQTIADFEELTFLKFASDQLGKVDLAAGVEPLVMRIIDSLLGAIRAQTVKLVFEECSESLPSLELPPFFSATSGKSCPHVLQLIEEFRDQIESNPFVKNLVVDDESWQHFEGIENFIIAPVIHDENRLGWLVAINRSENKLAAACNTEELAGMSEFGTVEAMIMKAAGAVIASHVVNVDLLKEQEELLTSMIRAFVSALDAKDAYTCGHSERVALYAKVVASKMGMDEDAVEKIYLTGLLHDIGKIGVGEQTLNHPGRLSDEQFDVIKLHPDSGWAILEGIRQIGYVLPGVLFHHERFDGKGYPDGLAKDEIPLVARILSVVDAYDAMTSDRPYRNGMPHEKAVDILREGSGTQWDPVVVQTFLDADEEINSIRKTQRAFQNPIRIRDSVESLETS